MEKRITVLKRFGKILIIILVLFVSAIILSLVSYISYSVGINSRSETEAELKRQVDKLEIDNNYLNEEVNRLQQEE